MRGYKHSNGRITTQGSNGRFKKTTFKNAFGIQPNVKRLICVKCGYGKRGDFIPLLETGYCPKCNNQEGHINLKDYAQGLIGLKFWYITDIWEKFCAIPVIVTSVSDKGTLTILWQTEDDDAQDYFPTFEVKDLTELHETQGEAEQAISERKAADNV